MKYRIASSRATPSSKKQQEKNVPQVVYTCGTFVLYCRLIQIRRGSSAESLDHPFFLFYNENDFQ